MSGRGAIDKTRAARTGRFFITITGDADAFGRQFKGAIGNGFAGRFHRINTDERRMLEHLHVDMRYPGADSGGPTLALLARFAPARAFAPGSSGRGGAG